jgi:hypothetical protein
MKTKLTIVELFPTKSGVSKAGKDWSTRDVLTKTHGEYPVDLLISFFGNVDLEKLDALTNGEIIETEITPSSREYNGKWYTSCRAFGVNSIEGGKTNSGSQDDSIDGLPF